VTRVTSIAYFCGESCHVAARTRESPGRATRLPGRARSGKGAGLLCYEHLANVALRDSVTRPLGAVVGDFLDKPIADGGLALSRYRASASLRQFLSGAFSCSGNGRRARVTDSASLRHREETRGRPRKCVQIGTARDPGVGSRLLDPRHLHFRRRRQRIVDDDGAGVAAESVCRIHPRSSRGAPVDA
jgi:hypothetical protein